MNVPFNYLPRVLLSEALKWRYAIVATFMTIAVVSVLIGLDWPKTYVASTTIYVEDRNIIQPLMQGAAVATTATDRAKIARQLIFSRKILEPALKRSGWFADVTSKLHRERIMESVKDNTRITNFGPNLIRIECTDHIPERAYRTAKEFAALFIEESTTAQTRESTDAFDFINSQVEMYHDKLAQAEQALKDFRSSHMDARPGTEDQVTAKITKLQEAIEQTSLQIKEAKIKEESLRKQLSGEAVVTTSLTREGQLVARIAELEGQLDTLRLSYRDTYPDVISIKHQIEELRTLIAAEREKRSQAKEALKGGSIPPVDDTVRANPLYQKLRAELLDTRTTIETLNARLTEMKHNLGIEVGRARKLFGGEATLAELTRDYEVNRDIYHDLLKRRENARVSKNLDVDKQGLTMRIQEPAALPVQPSGLRFVHFAAAGLLLGLIVPLGVLFVLQQVDPRVRVPTLVSERFGTPVLAAVPALMSPRQAVRFARSLKFLSAVVFLTVAFVAVTGVLKFTGRL